MGNQSGDHCARTGLWHTAMVALLVYSTNFGYAGLGQLSQGSAHTYRIQYHLDIHINYGTCPEPR